MASATGIPEQNPSSERHGEDEPLLGRAGDASQQPDKDIQFNLVIENLPAGMSSPSQAAFLLIVQAILILQPTHTPKQKKQGANVHAVLNGTGVLAFIAGLVVIEYNKIAHNGEHFKSPHAILGLITYILFVIQALIGLTQYYLPQIYGGEQNAKKIYKYHRMSGYVLLVLALATVAAATQTGFNKNVLHIQLWAVIAAALLTLAGVLPRIKKQKLGL
ncbi:MAG: hypothetical protein M1835_004110 [Candelina submexicana]|nr:MAG: hypothetical protein M1835_004110 [Candelina submexicana]